MTSYDAYRNSFCIVTYQLISSQNFCRKIFYIYLLVCLCLYIYTYTYVTLRDCGNQKTNFMNFFFFIFFAMRLNSCPQAWWQTHLFYLVSHLATHLYHYLYVLMRAATIVHQTKSSL